MGLVRSFTGTDGIWQYIPHINTGLFSIIKVHFLLFANLIVDWHINTINFTDSGFIEMVKENGNFDTMKRKELCKKYVTYFDGEIGKRIEDIIIQEWWKK